MSSVKKMLKSALIRPAFQKKNFEDKSVLKKIERIFIEKRGYVFKMPKPGESVVLLLSGGLDSVCLWYMLLKKYKLNVYPLHIFHSLINKKMFFLNNPQRKAIAFFSSFFKKKFPSLYHQPRFFYDKTPISLDGEIKLDNIKFNLPVISQNLAYNVKSKRYRIPVVRVPIRQLRYILNAYEYIHSLKYHSGIDINTVFCAILMSDSLSIREATLTVLRSVNLTFCLILNDFDWQFTGGLEKEANFCFYKYQLVDFAIKNGLPLEKTWSCVNSFFFQCGLCPSCKSRKNTFQLLNIPDRTIYLTDIVNKFIDLKKIKKIINFFRRLSFHQPNKKYFVEEKNPLVKIPLSNNLKLSVSPDTLWYYDNKTMFLLNKKKGLLESLNSMGSFIFRQITQKNGITLKTLLNLISKQFDVNKKTLRQDVIFFINQLIKKDYLKIN